MPAELGLRRQRGDQLAVQRDEDDDLADPAPLGDDADPPNRRRRGNGAVPTGDAPIWAHAPRDHARAAVKEAAL